MRRVGVWLNFVQTNAWPSTARTDGVSPSTVVCVSSVGAGSEPGCGLQEVACGDLEPFDVAVLGVLMLDVDVHLRIDLGDGGQEPGPVVGVVPQSEGDEPPGRVLGLGVAPVAVGHWDLALGLGGNAKTGLRGCSSRQTWTSLSRARARTSVPSLSHRSTRTAWTQVVAAR